MHTFIKFDFRFLQKFTQTRWHGINYSRTHFQINSNDWRIDSVCHNERGGIRNSDQGISLS